jgi:hypothetical protein
MLTELPQLLRRDVHCRKNIQTNQYPITGAQKIQRLRESKILVRKSEWKKPVVTQSRWEDKILE